jgi:cytosine/adenosine deaminase-related metal-dependent hydrolase
MVGNIGRLLILSLSLTPWLNAGEPPIAFVDVTVVPMDKEQTLPHQIVVVTAGRIAQVGPLASVKVPHGATKIDGKGRFLMPGLADMHVHLIRSALTVNSAPSPSNGSSAHTIVPASASPDHEHENQALGLLFIANGITPVRNMWGDPAVDAFARETNSGGVLGPHIYSTGPITDGKPYFWEGSRVVETQAQAEAAVSQDKQAGYIALKVYSGLSADAYNWLVSAARAQGLPVVGHVPDAVGLRGVIAAHQDSIEHMDGYAVALQPDPGAAANASWQTLMEKADLSKLPPLVESVRAAGIWTCPTLELDRALPDDAEWQRRIGLIPPPILERYRKMFPQWHVDPERTRRIFQFEVSIARALHQGGARLLLGTDTPKLTVLPAFSLHDELQNLVEAGLTPYEAIRAGTSDAAIFLHQESEFGTVAMGRRADLLLLEANPLEDVNNASKLSGVMVNGRWLAVADLQNRLVALRNGYQH